MEVETMWVIIEPWQNRLDVMEFRLTGPFKTELDAVRYRDYWALSETILIMQLSDPDETEGVAWVAADVSSG
jgi:hypothetical protein